MATISDTKTKNDEDIPPTVDKKKWKKRLWSDAEFLRRLREGRENSHYQKRMQHFFGTPVNLKTDLPLPEYATEFRYPAYRAEQLQDICNKATMIYATDTNTWGIPLYQYIFDIWSHGEIHTTDIEFGRMFAKFIQTSRSDLEKPTTQDVLKLHETLLDAVDTAKAKGFAQQDLAEEIHSYVWNVWNSSHKDNHQIEYFNIKPLCRALIIIIENPTLQLKRNFEQQLVRLIRTEWTAGLSRTISFQGLEIQEVITENEVVVLLPEAVRFIMALDEKEEALKEKRDPTVLDTWLGDPEDQITRIEKAAKCSEPMWTAGFWPRGPSTEWWELAKTLE